MKRTLLFRFFVLLLCICAGSGAVCADVRSATAADYSSLPDHPRLILRSDDRATLLDRIKGDSAVARLHRDVMARAERLFDTEPSIRQKRGRRLLHVSRQVMERVFNFAYAWMVTGDRDYAARAEEEMLAAAAFEDWNPSHFLDVAEMTAALAIGYDWLYDVLSEQSRDKIRLAIIEKGLQGAESERQMWFYRSGNNWNQVCNCGLVLGALAVAEHCPALAKEIVDKAVATNPTAQAGYAPDGVYPEGFGYWSYGTWFEVVMIEAMRTALGDSAGMERAEGFLESARFMNFMASPTGSVFSFSDTGLRKDVNPLLFWFASESGDRSLAWLERQDLLHNEKLRIMERRLLPIGVLFAARCDMSQVAPIAAKWWCGDGNQPICIYRGGWESRSDAYLAVKGGSASLSHAHMDAGSFVYELDGVRWSADLGMQDYHSLEKEGITLWKMNQESQRWGIFRLSAASHSTLTVDDGRHCVKGHAKITDTYDGADGIYGAKVDMGDVLFDIDRATRDIRFDEKSRSLSVEDCVTAGEGGHTLRWTMTTTADAEIVGRNTIVLTRDGRRMLLRVACQRKTTPFVLPNTPPNSYDAENKGTCRAGFTVKLPARRPVTLKVVLQPQK